MNRNLGLQEALVLAMDAELEARRFYAQAALEIQDPQGQDLLGLLAAFEQYHYEKLSELAQSLREEGAFIEYETRAIEEFDPLTGGGEAAGTLLEGMADPTGILSTAIENEKKAGQRYRALSEETADPRGQAMFRDLANEEMIHQRILEDEFFTLSNQGVWGWKGMYGE